MSDEKPIYTILMSREAVIKMLKENDPENECIKTLDAVGIDKIRDHEYIVFQGEQFKIIDSVVQKEESK